MGKTLLDEFAMSAMEAMLVKGNTNDRSPTYISKTGYAIAAAMMAERARRDETGNVKEVIR